MIWLQGIQGVLCIYEICALFYISHIFMQKRFSARKYGKLLIAVILFLGSITIYQRYIAGMYSRYYLMAITLLSSMFLTVLYKNNLKNFLLITLLYFENVYFCDLFILFLINCVVDDSEYAQYIQVRISVQRILILLITRIITCIILLFIHKYQLEVKRAFGENTRYMWFFVLFEFIALSYCDKIFFPVLQDNIKLYFSLFPIAIFSLCVLFIVYIMYCEKKRLVQIISERIELTEKNYQELILQYRDRDFIYHDLKNHLYTLTNLLEKNDVERALSYAKTISEPLKLLERKRWSGNIIVDILLSEVSEKADRKNINIKILCGNLRDCGVSDNDWCTILLNLFDNALEACEKVEESKRWISIVIKHRGNVILLDISNSFSGCLLKNKNGKLETTKENKTLHGIGLESVIQTVSKYGGDFQYKNEDATFQVYISILCNNLNGKELKKC